MTRKDLEPKKWGRKAWEFIDNVIEGYDTKSPTKKEELEMQKFMKSLGVMLPCQKCRMSFNSYLSQRPIQEHTQNRQSVRAWINEYKKTSRTKKK